MICGIQVHENSMCRIKRWKLGQVWSEHRLNLSPCYELVSGFHCCLVDQVVEPVCVGLGSKLGPVIAKGREDPVKQMIALASAH